MFSCLTTKIKEIDIERQRLNHIEENLWVFIKAIVCLLWNRIIFPELTIIFIFVTTVGVTILRAIFRRSPKVILSLKGMSDIVFFLCTLVQNVY